jgi:hypothetical protein
LTTFCVTATKKHEIELIAKIIYGLEASIMQMASFCEIDLDESDTLAAAGAVVTDAQSDFSKSHCLALR